MEKTTERCEICLKEHDLFYLSCLLGITHLCYRHPLPGYRVKKKHKTIFIEKVEGLPIPVEYAKSVLKDKQLENQLFLF